jgi:hypothetical protein
MGEWEPISPLPFSHSQLRVLRVLRGEIFSRQGHTSEQELSPSSLRIRLSDIIQLVLQTSSEFKL